MLAACWTLEGCQVDLLSNVFCLFSLQPLQRNLILSFQTAAPVFHVWEAKSELRTEMAAKGTANAQIKVS